MAEHSKLFSDTDMLKEIERAKELAVKYHPKDYENQMSFMNGWLQCIKHIEKDVIDPVTYTSNDSGNYKVNMR